MDGLTKEEAIVLGRSLNLPDVVLDIIKGKTPKNLQNYFSTPMVYDLTKLEQEAYGFGKVLPLWASTNGNIIYAYDFLNDDYFEFDWEGDILTRFSSWDDLLKENINRVIDVKCDDYDDKELLEVLRGIFSGFNIEDFDSVFWGVY